MLDSNWLTEESIIIDRISGIGRLAEGIVIACADSVIALRPSLVKGEVIPGVQFLGCGSIFILVCDDIPARQSAQAGFGYEFVTRDE